MVCFEFVVAIFSIVAIVKIADHEGLTPWAWGLVMFGVIVVCGLIPLPFVRVIIALVLGFALMIGWNVYQTKRD